MQILARRRKSFCVRQSQGGKVFNRSAPSRNQRNACAKDLQRLGSSGAALMANYSAELEPAACPQARAKVLACIFCSARLESTRRLQPTPNLARWLPWTGMWRAWSRWCWTLPPTATPPLSGSACSAGTQHSSPQATQASSPAASGRLWPSARPTPPCATSPICWPAASCANQTRADEAPATS